MTEQDTPSPGGDLYRVARIVGSYVQHHQIGSDQPAITNSRADTPRTSDVPPITRFTMLGIMVDSRST
jgi:hypothetical protein